LEVELESSESGAIIDAGSGGAEVTTASAAASATADGEGKSTTSGTSGTAPNDDSIQKVCRVTSGQRLVVLCLPPLTSHACFVCFVWQCTARRSQSINEQPQPPPP
jgi:hypothetical protein